jgi:hypothetical protein
MGLPVGRFGARALELMMMMGRRAVAAGDRGGFVRRAQRGT